MRNDQIIRQWKILRLLEAHRFGLSVQDIADELEENIRTIYRDLQALGYAGFAIYCERDNGSAAYKIMEGKAGLKTPPFTLTEYMALCVCRNLLSLMDGTVFHESFEGLLSKVGCSLTPETAQKLEAFSEGFSAGFAPKKDYSQCKDSIAEAQSAISLRKQVSFTYRAASTGEERTRTVHPYHIWVMNGVFYLVGYCRLRQEARTFCFDRIRDLAVLPDTFQYPEDFHIDEYFGTAFRVMTGEPSQLVIRFSPHVAAQVKEKIWRPSQQITDQPDGGIILTMQTAVNYEVVSWLLGFGDKAEVLEPSSLRERLQRELQKALESYSSDT